MKVEAILVALVLTSIITSFVGLLVVFAYPTAGLTISGVAVGLLIVAGVLLIKDIWDL